MWELDYKESWVPKNCCFWTVVLEKTLESPLDCKKIQPVNLKGNQCWIFIGKTDAEVETPILWPPDAKNWIIWKVPDAGKDGGQEEKETTEDEMAGWHHQLNGHEFEQAQGVGDGQGSLACSSPWGCQESDMTERLNWTDIYWVSDAIQPSHPLSSPSPPAFNLYQHQGLFKWVSSSHQVARVLEFQLQHQRRQWQPTPVLLPGKSHGRRSLVGCSPWDC